MQFSKRVATAIFATAMLSLAGCASTSTKEGTGEYVDDTVVTTKVKTAILAEKGLKSTEINVETFKGTVQLSGFVSSPSEISKAAEVARGVSGVTSVKNDLHVRP